MPYDYNYYGRRRHRPPEPVRLPRDPFDDRTPRSQKVKGMRSLRQAATMAGITVPKFTIVQSPQDVLRAWTFMRQSVPVAKRLFGRPCPQRPRHGFVDSVEVKTVHDITRLLKKTQAVDDGGEVMVCELVEAVANAVYRPGLLAVGPGHDGATAGHDSWSVPLVPAKSNWANVFMAQSGISETDEHGIRQVGYFEVVFKDNYRPVFTQLRGGPAIPSTVVGNYVPHDMVVKQVVVAEKDISLVEWELLMQRVDKHTVVYHPGGNLASHVFIHCFNNGIACLTEGSAPAVHDVLEATTVEPPDPLAVLDGIAAGTALYIDDKENRALMLKTIGVALHNSVVQSGKFGFNIGVGAVLMMRLGTAAALGELRHAKRMAKKQRQLKDPDEGKHADYNGKLDRDTVYEYALNRPFNGRRKLYKALACFLHDTWGGSFGGPKWADCTMSICELDDAIQAVVRDPILPNVQKMVECLNISLTKAHNGGWWMNKYGDKETFDKLAEGHPLPTIDAAPIFLEARLTDPAILRAALESWQLARPTRWQKAATHPPFYPNKPPKKLQEYQGVFVVDEGIPPDLAAKLFGENNSEGVTGSLGKHPVDWAQGKLMAQVGDAIGLHIQYRVKGQPGYRTTDVFMKTNLVDLFYAQQPVHSFAQTSTPYYKLVVVEALGEWHIGIPDATLNPPYHAVAKIPIEVPLG